MPRVKEREKRFRPTGEESAGRVAGRGRRWKDQDGGVNGVGVMFLD